MDLRSTLQALDLAAAWAALPMFLSCIAGPWWPTCGG